MAINDTGSALQTEASAKVKQLDSITTAIFFIWIGVAVLAKIGWTWSLFGIGVILLAQQAALNRQGAKVDGFRVFCGAAFLLGAVWEMIGMSWPLAPVLLILIGIGALWKAVFGER
ncbi:MAG: hypothetical protein WCC66_04165 [Rhizobiaceae bacterium]